MRYYAALAGSLAVIGFVGMVAFNQGSAISAGANFLQMQSENIDINFVNYIGQYQKQYASKEEFVRRMEIFQENFKKVLLHNSQNSASYKMKINRFSDMTPEEYKQMLGYKHMNGTRRHNPGENSFIVFNTTNLPQSVDWRPTGAVTKVKDQGKCGSCYAFSAIGAMEGAYWNATKKTVDLSVEQMVECASTDGY